MVTNSSDPQAANRMAAFRCRLNARYVGAAPLDAAAARSAPPAPGSCYWQ